MDARALLEADPARVAARILGVWAEGGAEAAHPPAAMAALAEAARGASGAWRRAARLVAGDERGRLELDVVPGLRTRLWQDGAGGTLPAIALLLAERARARAGDGELIQLRDARVWIPDTALPELAYHLELDARGLGLGWDRAPDAAELGDLAADAPGRSGGSDGGLARLWRRWTRWASAGARTPTRAWLAHPGVVGAIPATGLDARAEALAAVVAAIRHAPPAAPAVVRAAPLLLPWCRDRLPRARWLATLADAPAHRHLRAGATRVGLRCGLACDPVVALPAALVLQGAHGACTEPLAALVGALRANLRIALAGAAGGAARAAPWQVELAHRPGLPALSLCAQAGRLLIDAQGIATLAAWLGWFPLRYARERGGAWTWPWAALEACGWSALEAAGAWTRVRGPPTRPGSSADPWFACGHAAASVPRAAGWPAPLAALARTASAADDGDATPSAAVPDLLRWSA